MCDNMRVKRPMDARMVQMMEDETNYTGVTNETI